VAIKDRTVTIKAEHTATPQPSTAPTESPSNDRQREPPVMDMSHSTMRSYSVPPNVELDKATAQIMNGRFVFSAPFVPEADDDSRNPNVVDIDIRRE